ncbi:uncharacterized protein LOC121392881 [Gigantopelta aegis]|uniref:uncharacterized protein LOC121392881 n=1 Tax=Gigantopelta aegis TaxID=1735272 RepID=UPI001B88DFAB|nr:uncharacterized protein LOC121392881 [Gigantopelta aegis]
MAAAPIMPATFQPNSQSSMVSGPVNSTYCTMPQSQSQSLSSHQYQPYPNIQPGFQLTPSQSMSGINTSPPPWAQELSAKMDCIFKQLEKLDAIENSISLIQTEVKQLGERVRDVEVSQQFINTILEEDKSDIKDVKSDLSILRKSFDYMQVANNKLSEEIIDLQSRSMRDNLLFFNIAENEGENCTEVIKKVCVDNLDYQEPLEIDRAHRIGKLSAGKQRPIVVKFRCYPQPDAVKKSSRKLKNTNFSIGEQFPKIVQERRKTLLPVFKEAMERGKKTALVRDKLYINGVLYTGPEGSQPA